MTYLALAPMEGVTDLPLRAWLWLASAPDSVATPFLRATPTFPHKALPPEFAPELDVLKGTVPWTLVVQVMAAETADFLRAADYLLAAGAPFVELNAGCPAPTCTGKGAGSSLLRDPGELADFVGALAGRLGPGRLAVKMRTGYATDEGFAALLDAVRDLPLARLTVHGRTRPVGYRGFARWDLIQAAAAASRAPVIGSGDVVDAASLAARRGAAPQAAGVIVGRGALRNPWIFRELRDGRPVPLPTAALAPALTAFALMTSLFAEAPATLLELLAGGLAAGPCGVSPAAWSELAGRLAAAHGPTAVSRRTLGRVKMVWSYLRSSLPPPFFAPTLLRAASVSELIAGIGQVALAAGSPQTLTLQHRADLDWVYGNRGREEECASSTRVQAASSASTSPASTRLVSPSRESARTSTMSGKS